MTVRIVIELDAVEEPIQGRLIEPELQAGEFRGWLGLTALIETTRLDALKARERANPDQPPAHPGA